MDLLASEFGAPVDVFDPVPAGDASRAAAIGADAAGPATPSPWVSRCGRRGTDD